MGGLGGGGGEACLVGLGLELGWFVVTFGGLCVWSVMGGGPWKRIWDEKSSTLVYLKRLRSWSEEYDNSLRMLNVSNRDTPSRPKALSSHCEWNLSESRASIVRLVPNVP